MTEKGEGKAEIGKAENSSNATDVGGSVSGDKCNLSRI